MKSRDLFFLFSFKGCAVADGSSQAGGWIRAAAASLCHIYNNSDSNAGSGLSVTCITAHGNTRSLIHWARPVIEPTSSWLLLSHNANISSIQLFECLRAQLLIINTTDIVKKSLIKQLQQSRYLSTQDRYHRLFKIYSIRHTKICVIHQ